MKKSLNLVSKLSTLCLISSCTCSISMNAPPLPEKEILPIESKVSK